MSAAILDKARAFDLIARHLTETKRAEIAEALGERLLAEVKPSKSSGSARAPREPAAIEPSEEDKKMQEVVEFLLEKGCREGELVRATTRLADWLKSPAFGHLPRAARMQTWWATQRDGRPE